MCTSDRLANHLEGYMDDLVVCLEEFVKKSILVVSVAVGTLVLMVMYVLKLMSERSASRGITDDSAETVRVNNTSQVSTQQLTQTAAQNPGKNMDPFRNDYLPVANMRTISLQVIPNTYSSFGPSYAESFINEIDLGFNSKSFDTCKQTQVSDDLKSARPESNFMSTRRSCVIKRMTMYRDWELLTRTAQSYIWAAYCAMSGNYIAVATVVVVLILSLLLPDITQKLHAAQDLKVMKKVIDKMSDEVKRAEVACLTVADDISYLQRNMNDDTTETSKDKLQELSAGTSRSMRATQSEPTQNKRKGGALRDMFCQNRNTSNKEVTIMSYVYTNSFDDTNKTEQEEKVTEQ